MVAVETTSSGEPSTDRVSSQKLSKWDGMWKCRPASNEPNKVLQVSNTEEPPDSM